MREYGVNNLLQQLFIIYGQNIEEVHFKRFRNLPGEFIATRVAQHIQFLKEIICVNEKKKEFKTHYNFRWEKLKK